MSIFDWWKRKPRPTTGLPSEDSELLVAGGDLLDPQLLAAWRWLVREDFSPVLCTSAGDLFLQASDGAVFWLDVANGAFRSAARNAEELDVLARERDRFDLWFKPGLVGAARKRHRPLTIGECYSYVRPPRLGGTDDVANLVPRSIAEHFSTHGRTFRPER